MNQAQIHALKILSMNTDDLREEIANTAKENPVLQIDDRILEKKFSGSKIKNSSTISQSGQKSSDAFQNIMEQKEDTRESLTEHLLHQLHMERLDENEIAVGEKLIYNLDSQGHHVLEPATLLDKNNPGETLQQLNKIINLIQSFDPIGVCTKNIEESLLVQAKQNPLASDLTIFILDGHLDFINPPAPERATKKIKNFISQRKKLFGLSQQELKYLSIDFDETDVQESIDLIKTLTPFPAAGFSTEDIHLISPDIYVTEVPKDSLETEDETVLKRQDILKTGDRYWKIQIQNANIPTVSIAPDLRGLEEKQLSKEMKEKLNSALDFIAMLESRKSTIEKSAWEIVLKQHAFFEKGPGHLVPYRLKDLAENIGVAESTVSRMANGKYLQYNGSVYPLKYFFESSATGPKQNDKAPTDEGQALSRDNVQLEIKKLLEEHKADSKKLSDQKISDLLEEKGIKIARRTVAKYRALLNIDSSYDR